MNTNKDGGPALPSHGSMGEVSQEGMTLRDYFASAAMAAMIVNKGMLPLKYVGAAYEYADAMLKAREVQS